MTNAEDTGSYEDVTDRYVIQLETCGRCGSEVDVFDLETDPRWGEVCDRCHAELVAEYGEWSR